MKGRRKRRSSKSGLSPGTPLFVGEQHMNTVSITVTSYDEAHYRTVHVQTAEEAVAAADPALNTWIDVCGIHDAIIIGKLTQRFNLHPLVLEDILHTDQRVKMDEFEGYLFVVMKDFNLVQDEWRIESDQISLIMTPKCVLTFQERPGDSFDAVRKRLASGRGRMRRLGPDYLLYALLDATVDTYYLLLERFGEAIENLEDTMMLAPAVADLNLLHRMRRDLLVLRRAVWPLRDVLSAIERHESPLISDETRIFTRDLYDHVVQVIDSIETSRDLLSSMVEIYLSTISNRTNAVMQTLTAITAIFIPLTFLAGVYGMNFKHMPELEWRYSYFVLWAIMLTIAGILLVFFRRKKWI